MTVLGNLEIREEKSAVVLRMHNRVDGHEGCWFTHAEIEKLIGLLQGVVSRRSRRTEIERQIETLQTEYEDLL